MKARSRIRIFCKEIIKDKNRKEIGVINLVNYLTGESIPHLEFRISEQFRNQGIMTKELPKYLKLCKKYGFNRMIANVKQDNLYSIKLLEKNNFFKVTSFKDLFIYAIDLNLIDCCLNFQKEWLSDNPFLIHNPNLNKNDK